MEESRRQKPVTNAGDTGKKGREADATSNETLDELEEEQNISTQKGQSNDASASSDVPSPDGAFDADRSEPSNRSEPM